jgi:hypothetical protein
MNESPQEWILKRRHEDLSLTVRMCWDLYLRFYTVFLTFSVIGLGWVVMRPADIQMVPRAKQVIAIVFVIQTVLTAITSGAIAVYTVHVAHDQEQIEGLLTQSQVSARPTVRSAVPAWLAQWGGWSNCAAMLAMAALWLYVGFH